jgi:ribose-phosphate pyrophosphokinase
VHGVLCGPAVELLRASQIQSIVLTNTVHLPPEKRLGKITQLNIAPLLAAAIERIHGGETVGALLH